MEPVFTFFKKQGFIVIIIGIVLLLAGCGATTEPVDENTAGFFNHFIVYPFSFCIKFFAGIFGGNYGISIIIMTLLIRFVLLPLMMKQSKNQLVMKEKMAVIGPEMKEIQEKYKANKDPKSQQNMQKEMMELYKKHEFNPLTSMGCLPMLVQFPILMGFYFAIMRTPEIAQHSFLWFNLGQQDMILPVIAAVVYYIQFKVSQAGTAVQPGQEQMMKLMGILTPAMMGIFSFTMAAALPLYWTVGGIFLIFQTYLAKMIYKPTEAPAIATSVEK